MTQIALALRSSPIPWTGEEISIVAFSLGAPIALAFAAKYPSSIRSLVLLGPAGLLRKLPEGYDDRLMRRHQVAPPEAVREKVRQILGVASSGPALELKSDQRSLDRAAPSRVEKVFDMGAVLQWQFDYHQGHVHSFRDTIRYGPLQAIDWWRKGCDVIAGRTRPDTALHNSKLLVFFGKDDDVVVGEETTEDILKLIPASHLQTEYLPGGHGFPYPNSDKITETILSFWSSGHSVQ